MQLADQIDRRAGLDAEQFEREYMHPPRPVILTDAIAHWSALGKWTPSTSRTTTAISGSWSTASR